MLVNSKSHIVREFRFTNSLLGAKGGPKRCVWVFCFADHDGRRAGLKDVFRTNVLELCRGGLVDWAHDVEGVPSRSVSKRVHGYAEPSFRRQWASSPQWGLGLGVQFV